MISSLIATGIFAAQHYDTPESRTVLVSVGRGARSLPDKNADENLDYRTDWSVRLDGDTIAGAAVVEREGGIVPTRVVFDDIYVSFWMAGGQPGLGAVEVIVTTTGGRQLTQLLTITSLNAKEITS